MRPWLLRPAVADFWASRLFSGVPLVTSPKSCEDMPRRPGEVGLYFLIAISDSLEKLDVVAGLEGHERLLPGGTLPREPTHALDLAAHDERADVGHGDLEQVLHRAADLDLVRVASDLKHEIRRA